MARGFSKETLGGRTINYNERGQMTGYSVPGLGGRMMNYDVMGSTSDVQNRPSWD